MSKGKRKCSSSNIYNKYLGLYIKKAIVVPTTMRYACFLFYQIMIIAVSAKAYDGEYNL